MLHPTWLQPFQGSLGQHLQAKMNPAPCQTCPQIDEMQSRRKRKHLLWSSYINILSARGLLSFVVLHLRTACLIQQKLVQLQLAQTSTCCIPGLYGGRGPGGRGPPRCIAQLHHKQIAGQTVGGLLSVCTPAALMLSNSEMRRRRLPFSANSRRALHRLPRYCRV